MSRTSTQKLVRLDSLQPHPENVSIYRDAERTSQENDDLLNSLKTHGLWEGQLQVHAQSMTLLSGHRRLLMAQEIGLEEAVVTLRNDLPDDPADPEVVQFLLNGNASREKTNIEKLREFEIRKAVEAKLAKRRSLNAPHQKSRSGPEDRVEEKGESRDIAARKTGLGSGSRAEKALKALHKADELTDSNPEKAAEIKEALNRSLTTGAKVAQVLTAQKPVAVQAVVKAPRLVDSSTQIEKKSVVIDGKRHRSMAFCRSMPEFTEELEFLQKELTDTVKRFQLAERKLRKIGERYCEKFADDRYFPDYMTVITTAWKQDETFDYQKQLDALSSAFSLSNSALTGLIRFTQTNEVMIDD